MATLPQNEQQRTGEEVKPVPPTPTAHKATVGKESFVRFVYPFLFDPDTFVDLTRAVSKAAWSTGAERRSVWKSSCFSEEDLLPHVARYQNAGGCDVSDTEAVRSSTAHIWSMQQDALDSVNWGLGAKAEWTIELARNRTIRFHWAAIDLALFRLGTGFLTIEACPHADDLSSWVDFVHYFRFLEGKRSPLLKARRRTGPDSWVEFHPSVVPKRDAAKDAPLCVSDIADCILLSAAPGVREGNPWWRDVFVPGQTIPYVCILAENAPAEQKDKAELLYRLRTLFHSGQTLHPSESDLNLEHDTILPYARDQWFFFTLDGGGYLALNPPQEDFFLKTMPDHVRKQYFLLFLLSANQRFSLVSLQQEVADKWLSQNVSHREMTFERIYEHLLEFEARVYFAQVMQRDHHHRCYRKCQEVYQIAQLHEELSGEVDRMYERISLERSERMQRRIDLLTFMIGLPALIFGFMSVPWDTLNIPWSLRIVALLGLIAVGGVLVQLVRRSEGTHLPQTKRGGLPHRRECGLKPQPDACRKEGPG